MPIGIDHARHCAQFSLVERRGGVRVASVENPDFRVLFEQAPAPLLVVRTDAPTFTIVAANDAYLAATRRTREEILGRGIFEAFADHDPAKENETNARASFRRVIQGRSSDALAVMRFDVGGEERHWSPVHAPVLDAHGEVAFIVLRVEDVTDLVRMKHGFGALEREVLQRAKEIKDASRKLEARGRELEEINRDLDSFTYSVSHDLRAPLRAIDGFAKILAEEHAPALGDEGRRVTNVICRNAQRMSRLIDDLLGFSRLGRAQLQLGPVDMGSLARGVAAELREPSRVVDLRIGDLPRCWGDPALLRQVWVNLLSNALKYSRTRERAVIEVTGRVDEGAAIYEVRDNGVGFDPKWATKLFGVFQRLHSAEEFEGTGVGLALVHRIVRRHDGWVRGEGRPGEGATFTFALHQQSHQRALEE
jgi:PAS domain S-box-containing protein